MYQVGIFSVKNLPKLNFLVMLFTRVNLKFFLKKFRFQSFQMLITVLCKGRVIDFPTQVAHTKHTFQWFGGFCKGENKKKLFTFLVAKYKSTRTKSCTFLNTFLRAFL